MPLPRGDKQQSGKRAADSTNEPQPKSVTTSDPPEPDQGSAPAGYGVATFDGGVEQFSIPERVRVLAVTDRVTGRVLDPGQYTAGDDGTVSRVGGVFTRGRRRWSVEWMAG